MNCERFQVVAADLARNQVMEASERASAQAHVDECGGCRKALSDQQELSGKLRMVAGQMRSSRAPEHLGDNLLAAFRDQNRVRSIHPAPTRRGHWLTAAAAILLAFFGLLVWRWQVAAVRPLPAQTNSASAPAPPPETPKPETVTAGPQSPTPPLSGSAPRRVLPRQRPSSQLAKGSDAKQLTVKPDDIPATDVEAKEVVTDFVSIGYGSASDLQYGGQLVRVELPRSVLARFGLPMNMNRVDERVKADVLVGSDGLARAIRFVSATNKN